MQDNDSRSGLEKDDRPNMAASDQIVVKTSGSGGPWQTQSFDASQFMNMIKDMLQSSANG